MKTWSPRVSTDLNSEPLPWDENLFQKKIQGMKLGWIFGMNWWFYRVQPMRLILQHRTGIIYIWSCAYCTSLHKFLGLTDNDYGPLREKKNNILQLAFGRASKMRKSHGHRRAFRPTLDPATWAQIVRRVRHGQAMAEARLPDGNPII